MFGRGPKVPPAPRRSPHPNPVVEARLHTIDLVQQRIDFKQQAIVTYHRRIDRLLDKIQQGPHGVNSYRAGIEDAYELLAGLELDIKQLYAQVQQLQGEAEAVEERWLAQAIRQDRSVHVNLYPDQVEDGQHHQNADENR